MQGKIIFVSLFLIAKPYFVSMVYVYFCLSFQKKKSYDPGSSHPGSVYDFKGTALCFIVKDDVDCRPEILLPSIP